MFAFDPEAFIRESLNSAIEAYKMSVTSNYGGQPLFLPIMRLVDLRIILTNVNPQLTAAGTVIKALDEYISNAVSNCDAAWNDPLLPLHWPMLLDHVQTAIAIMEKLWVTSYEHKGSIKSLVDKLLFLLHDTLQVAGLRV